MSSSASTSILPKSSLGTVPLTLFYVVFFLAPIGILIFVSLFDSPLFENLGLEQYRRFFTDDYSVFVLLDTLRLGAFVTFLALILGYAIAYIYVEAPRTARVVIVLIVITPLLTSTVVRAFAWIVILGRQGLVNQAIAFLGLSPTPLRLLNTELGLVLALAQIEMPLMVLPLITAMSSIDPRVVDASRSLGADRARTFFRVQLPLSLPGAIAGATLIFVASMSAFVSQSLIGGGRLVYMPTHLYEQAVGLQNWPFAAAIAVMLLVSVIVVLCSLLALGEASRRHARV